ncbi:hypothetical protein [Paenibacillus sp. y28]|uniref:hypothetical protein n=1 Tax=Paenibacillus sp. y28 TaxID=3129110 RepID=UPI003019AB7E
MKYFIAYRGKPYGQAMAREEAELKLQRLGRSFDGLDLVLLPVRRRKSRQASSAQPASTAKHVSGNDAAPTVPSADG